MALSTELESLTTDVVGATFEAIAYQWNPQFSVEIFAGSTAHDFDVIEWDGDLYRATSSGVEVYTSGAWAAVSGYAAASGQLTTVPPSLVADTALNIFVATSTGISHRTYNGSSWSSWSEIATQADVRFLAATSATRVHYLHYNTTTFNSQFRVLNYSGSWSLTQSDIYWGYPIQSFAAKRVGVRDILAFVAQVPGVNKSEVVGTQVTKTVLPAGGVFVIPYQYATWGDHITIDKVDNWSATRSRSNVTMTIINGMLNLTCWSVEDAAVGLRLYQSQDGMYWSRGELFPLPQATFWGAALIEHDDLLFAVTDDVYFTAPITIWFGSAHTDTVQDITDLIQSWSIQRSDMQQLSMVLEFDTGQAGTLIYRLNTFAVRFSTGFGEDLIPIGWFEVDTIEPTNELPLRSVRMVARDRLAWLSSRSQSEQFKNWEPQAIGVDNYKDSTGTGYGGMTHTFPFVGSYKTIDDELALKTSNAEGIAASTYHYDEWNGSVASGFTLSTLDNQEYAGVVFRMQDKDNCWFWVFFQSEDEIHLIHRVAGVNTTLYATEAMGWAANLNTRYLRVDFHYSHLSLYHGNNQGEWTQVLGLVIEGQDTDPIIQAGYVGTMGYGFSDEDEWESTPPPFPVLHIDDDYDPPTFIVADFDYEED